MHRRRQEEAQHKTNYEFRLLECPPCRMFPGASLPTNSISKRRCIVIVFQQQSRVKCKPRAHVQIWIFPMGMILMQHTHYNELSLSLNNSNIIIHPKSPYNIKPSSLRLRESEWARDLRAKRNFQGSRQGYLCKFSILFS